MGKLCNQFTFCFWTAWLTQSLLLHYHDIIYILHEHTVVFQAFIALSINTIYIIYMTLSVYDNEYPHLNDLSPSADAH